jgi:hypothetical protein
MDTRRRDSDRSVWVYYDIFCNRYWNRKKREWVKYMCLDCAYDSAREAQDDHALYKGEDTKLQRKSYSSFIIALAA